MRRPGHQVEGAVGLKTEDMEVLTLRTDDMKALILEDLCIGEEEDAHLFEIRNLWDEYSGRGRESLLPSVQQCHHEEWVKK